MRTFLAAIAVSLLLLAPLAAQRVQYELHIVDVAQQLAEVRATFPAAGKDALELFLPTWSPGFYAVENYHQDVVAFAVTAGGAACAGQAFGVSPPKASSRSGISPLSSPVAIAASVSKPLSRVSPVGEAGASSSTTSRKASFFSCRPSVSTKDTRSRQVIARRVGILQIGRAHV